ncbi:C4-type zinc ribbon domain-containing protein [Micromonospora phytophila]|uniref:zinc ribbon domain-containing protein n=1 Tax=Micromonospora phytophila TaxID=709888 RepID=UPI00202E294D|nr:C4-type zinc ribbon domain-containing protein [Micromonospora phytophila]MCM0678310.1 C4-type zinc ribbon domain-containing protein [Micromonospora phytophila]
MKADPKVQRRLLDLQAIDTALTQLAHRRRTLPERAELEALARELSALEDDRVRAQVAVDDLDRDIARLEKDIDQVRARKSKDETRLAAGTGPARELEALQHELVSLNRRQGDLEDAELELMEQRETAQSVLDGVEQRLAETREKREAAERRRDEALAGIAKEEEFKRGARQPLAADLPADLITLYDKVRENSGGLGAALLTGGRCGGCRLELSGADRARIAKAEADEVVRCEECRRIMVRTNESGL